MNGTRAVAQLLTIEEDRDFFFVSTTVSTEA